MTARVDALVDELFAAAQAVQANAHAPYSRFRVGAAVRTASGKVFAGCNVENAAYPQGSCAEAGAISAMVAAGESKIVAVLTICDGAAIATCCGGCRQRVRGLPQGNTPIAAAGPDGARAALPFADRLPHSARPA